jgi:hypothetical protein
MTNSSEETSKKEYDAILRKLDILLRKHQGALSASKRTKANMDPDSRPFSASSPAREQVSPAGMGDIPTLTEVVCLPPSLLTSSSDLMVLLGQIVDSALKDANVELATEARRSLVKALRARLFRP